MYDAKLCEEFLVEIQQQQKLRLKSTYNALIYRKMKLLKYHFLSQHLIIVKSSPQSKH